MSDADFTALDELAAYGAAIRNATLRDVVAHLRATPWYVVKEITDRDGRPWPLVSAKSKDDFADEIEAMIEEEPT